ncbi:hypothetical protein AQJ66_24395 [Streptomyces bungoensis]|uniref:Uncharacterized protein n=1 Tax=Streptomyces bungoensis TaxID=285568 RepID=A0A101SVT0_9ACTN|nr:hypothetical protein [Streptomyces bungoensis]KUN81110.1 hypothetical protein AQJ66_24395 [Streptomyces bungoensis]
MDDKAVERTDEPNYVAGPWWADLGTWGAVALIVLGCIAAAWVFLGLPGTPQEPASGYHGAAKLIAIGLVTVGCTLMSRRRGQPAAGEKTNE